MIKLLIKFKLQIYTYIIIYLSNKIIFFTGKIINLHYFAIITKGYLRIIILYQKVFNHALINNKLRMKFVLLALLALAACNLANIEEEYPIVDEPNGEQKGIDVSSYQGTINWTKVKNAGIKFAILRTTVKGGSMDSTFEYNYKNAKAAGLPVYGYHYSYSLSTSEAKSAAKNLISKLNGKKLRIYIDLEWGTQGNLGKQKVTDIAKAFLDTMKNAGYSVGVYSNKNWYSNYYYPSQLKSYGKMWIAAYGKNDGSANSKYKPNVGEFIWQYTSVGKVNGISGNVDMDIMYGTD
jgi:GH25 family lysozyme M1 (1,4-beta-N-acetylmuramidase)